MNQQSGSKHVSGRQGLSGNTQPKSASKEQASDRHAHPSRPEAAAPCDGIRPEKMSFGVFLLSMPKDDQGFERITLKVKEIEW